MVKQFITVFICILLASHTQAQEIKPVGHFLSDSIKIGEEVQFALSVKYPKKYQVIFPDSTFNYGSFEYYSKQYFDTKADSTFAIDSVIYGVSTFEIDPILQLQLPVYLINGKDSVEILSNIDSIILVQYVAQVPDSIQLIKNVDYYEVSYEFNYPYLMIALGVIFVLAIAILIIFGKRIRTAIKLYRLKKEYEKFSIQLDRGITQIRRDQSDKSNIEEVLVVWKTYMERLVDKPFTKYTSKEISKAEYSQDLVEALRNIDRAIYSTATMEEIHRNFETVSTFTSDQYQQKTKELKNG